MSGEWVEIAFKDFCMSHGVTIQAEDDRIRHRFIVIMRAAGRAVTRYLDYDVIPTLLPTPFLWEMYNEFSKEEVRDDG